MQLKTYHWVLGALVLAVVLFAWPSTTHPAALPSPAASIRSAKLDAYLSVLAWKYECVGDCQRAQLANEPYKRIDSNGLYSYGCLQFQQATYLMIAKKYKVDPWANGGIYNCENQMALARLMFLEDKAAASQHWYTSIYTRGLGLPNV